jgi:Synergist-CTERM protein sorting domain-containing protein
VYVLFAISYNGVDEYDPSEIVEFDLELNYKRTFKLEDTGNNGVAGKNPARMAYYNGKLYVACMGGFQGPNSWGDIWEVDLAAASPAAPKRVLDGHAIPHDLGGGTYAAVGMYGIQFASDGTAYILTGSYDSGYTFRARLFVTTAADLAAGNVTNNNNVVATYTTFDGHSWDILYDEEESMLWCMAGKTLQARSKDGKTLVKSFKPIDLGDDIYSISLLSDGSVLSSGGGGGGGGGGCDAGFTSAALLMLALGLMLRRRKGNRP